MKSLRISQKTTTKAQHLKTFLFDIIFVFTTNSLTNPILLLILDLLQLLIIPYMYIHPIYSHLTTQPALSTYFSNIFPYLYYIRTNNRSDSFPVCMMVYTLCIVLLAVMRKHGSNAVVLFVEIELALLPILAMRVVSQVVNMDHYGIVLKVFTFMFIPFVAVAVVMVLVQYKKPLKVLDMIAAALLLLNINQYAMISFLAIKIIISLILQPPLHAKYIKLSLQSSLLFSLILLIFIQPILINYIMLIVLISISLLYSTFKVYIAFEYKDISRIKIDQDDQYCTQNNYTWVQVNYFQKMNMHINNCMQVECMCRQLINIHDLKQLKKWAPMFYKHQLKLIALCANTSNTNSTQKQNKNQNYFIKQIQYIQACLQAQQPDFYGFIKLHQLHPHTIIQQYYKYSNMKKYSLYLQKSTPKILNMSIVNQTQDSNPYDQLLQLENQICRLIQKVKIFWHELLDYNGGNQFAELIEEISDDINKIHAMYDSIQQNYDEKEQADYYYNIFKLLTLHQRPSAALIDNHKSKYIMVTRGETIINITVNITHLMQRSRHQVVGHKYTMLMSQVYANQHAEWVREYMYGYRPCEDNSFVKVINITNTNIKVVNMTHLLMPCLGSEIEVDDEGKAGMGVGVNVISLLYQKLEDDDIDMENQEMVFHMLVCRNTLDVIAFEEVVFEFFNEKPTVDNSNKILRANLKKIFPNLNKQALLKKGDNCKKLIAKYNKYFFEIQDFKTKQSIAKYSLAQTSQGGGVLRKSKQKLLHVEEVYNEKNQKLNLILLKFETIMQKQLKQGVGKKTSQDLQLDLLKKKTLKNIMQSTKQKKSKAKQSDQGLAWCKLLLCLSFLIAFVLKVLMFTFFEIQYESLSPLLQKWDKKQKLYTDLQYTQSYFLNFQFGENRISQMQKYWNFNQQYTNIITIYKQIHQQSFNIKFLQYVQQFQKVSSFKQLNEQINSRLQSIIYIEKVIFIFFYCALGLVVLNLLFSIATFLKSLSKSIAILSSFLKFDQKQIQNNIKRIEGLQTLLQLHDFMEVYDQQAIKEEEKQLQSSTPLIKEQKMSSINSITKIDSVVLKSKAKISFKEDKKINFHLILNNYFANQNGSKQGDQTSLSSIGKPQPPTRRKTIKLSSRKLKKDLKSKQSAWADIADQNNNQQVSKQYPLSMTNSIAKNKYNLIAPVCGFILKLMLAITLILFISNVMDQTIKCVQLKNRLIQQPALMLQTVEYMYFTDKKQYDLRLIFYYFDCVERMAKLPSQFNQFKQFQQIISTTVKNLCEYLDRSLYNDLYVECKKDADIFRSGMETVIQFIEQRIRKTAVGTFSKQYLKQKNQLSLAVKVSIYVMNLRNIQYTKAYEKYYEKYTQIKFLVRIVYIFVFLCCLYLQAKELQYTSHKTKKTQNLFKIVPPFMKNDLEKNHISKQAVVQK